MRKRRSARVLLFDPAGSILLIRFVVPRDGQDYVFWLTPGGEIEPGELESAAAERELFEELGLQLKVEGPVHAESNSFLHQGEMRDNTDCFFRASCERSAPLLSGITPEEIAVMKEIRWWTLEEIEHTGDLIFPRNLPQLIRQLP